MTDLSTLLNQAERQLDENDYPSAREGYRSAALQSPPSFGTLVNLSVAEEQDILAFRKLLAQAHPESFLAVFSYPIAIWKVAHNARLAIHRFRELLENRTWEWKDELQIRITIWHLAIEVGNADLVVAEFKLIWEMLDKVKPRAATSMRQGLLCKIAGCEKAELVPALRELAQMHGLANQIVHFLKAKAGSLEALQAATGAMKDE